MIGLCWVPFGPYLALIGPPSTTFWIKRWRFQFAVFVWVGPSTGGGGGEGIQVFLEETLASRSSKKKKRWEGIFKKEVLKKTFHD